MCSVCPFRIGNPRPGNMYKAINGIEPLVNVYRANHSRITSPPSNGVALVY
nr:MAG TPA: hypothetical protein [Caudoviricetes sp.]DAX62280.1 MAG TPA: hypothetical protein [Caudoviricetes sp.]